MIKFMRSQGFVIAILIMALMANYWPAIQSSRQFRDLTGRTPFHSVTVDIAWVGPDGYELLGTMVKRRCEFKSLSAYAVLPDGVTERAEIDTSPEDSLRPSGNRPALPEAQKWGPWRIVYTREPAPAGWVIYAHHICPESPSAQTNEFARGVWSDYD